MTQPYQWRADEPDKQSDKPGAVTPASSGAKTTKTPKTAAATPKTPAASQAYRPAMPPSFPVTTPRVAPPPAPMPQPAPRPPHSAQQKLEATATLGAYDELGPEYQDAVIESFLTRMDTMNAQRRQPMPGPYPMGLPVPVAPGLPAKRSKAGGLNIATLVICLALAIPLTAIAASFGGFLGMVLAWVGVVLVAFITQRGRDKE